MWPQSSRGPAAVIEGGGPKPDVVAYVPRNGLATFGDIDRCSLTAGASVALVRKHRVAGKAGVRQIFRSKIGGFSRI